MNVGHIELIIFIPYGAMGELIVTEELLYFGLGCREMKFCPE